MILRFFLVGSTFVLSTSLPQILSTSEFLYIVLTVPGTFLHELAHYGFAVLMNGFPSDFTILPRYENGELTSLGSVQFSVTSYNAATVALAPILLFPFSVWLILFSDRFSTIPALSLIYFAACGFNSCEPSPPDWAVAVSEPMSFVIAVPILLLSSLFWFFMIRKELQRNKRSPKTL